MVMLSKKDLLKFISERFNISLGSIDCDTDFRELGIDSLYIYAMIDSLQNKYNISVDIEDMADTNTINKLYEYIKEKDNNKNSHPKIF